MHVGLQAYIEGPNSAPMARVVTYVVLVQSDPTHPERYVASCPDLPGWTAAGASRAEAAARATEIVQLVAPARAARGEVGEPATAAVQVPVALHVGAPQPLWSPELNAPPAHIAAVERTHEGDGQVGPPHGRPAPSPAESSESPLSRIPSRAWDDSPGAPVTPEGDSVEQEAAIPPVPLAPRFRPAPPDEDDF